LNFASDPFGKDFADKKCGTPGEFERIRSFENRKWVELPWMGLYWGIFIKKIRKYSML